MARRARYLVDASVLMEAHRRYYRFAVCPGFWDALIWHHKQGTISSIDRKKLLATATARSFPGPEHKIAIAPKLWRSLRQWRTGGSWHTRVSMD